MRYRVLHTTQYTYSEPVPLGHNEAYLLPRTLAHQQCLASQLQIEPVPTLRCEREDFFGNRVVYFAIHEPHTRLIVTACSEVQIVPRDMPSLSGSPPWETVCEHLRYESSPAALEARQFVLDSPFVCASPILAAYAEPSFGRGRPVLEAVHDLMRRIHHDFTYDPHFTTVATPVSEVFEHRRGVCQDFAHLALGSVRSLGLAARYVSGYLETPSPDKADFIGAAASHAWLSVYSPEHGWIDFDPTNDQIPAGQHIVVAWGRDYSDVTPLKGVILGGGEHALQVTVEVNRVGEGQPKQED